MTTTRSDDEAHDTQIVADEKIGQVRAPLEIHEQVQHLRLDRHVECRDRFVAHQELGLHRERARDADARALTARELMRIAAHQRRIEPDAIEHRADVLAALSRRDQPMRDGRLADDVDDAHPRIQRCIRILEDHLQLAVAACALRRCELRRAAHRASSARRPTATTVLRRAGRASTCRSPIRRPGRRPRPAQDREVDVVDGTHDFLAHARAEAVADPRRKVERLDEALATRRAARSAASPNRSRRGCRRGAVQRRERVMTPDCPVAAVGERDIRRDDAIRHRLRAPLAKRAAGRQVEQRRRHARNLRQPARRARCSTAPNRGAPACRDAAALPRRPRRCPARRCAPRTSRRRGRRDRR